MNDSKTCETPRQTGLDLCKDGVVGAAKNTEDKPFNGEYRALIGSLTYLSNGTRPDICFTVNKLAVFNDCARTSHWTAAKRVLLYLKGTTNVGVTYAAGEDLLSAFSDADFAACVDTRRSITGILIKLSGGPIIWKAVKQKTVATSTVNAEFVAASMAATEIIWARQQMEQIGIKLTEPTKLMCDFQGAIKLINNDQAHSKIKHIDIRLLLIRETVDNKLISVEFVPTSEQQADILTKNIPTVQFNILKKKMNVMASRLVICALALTSLATNVASTPGWSRPKYASLKMISSCEQFSDLKEWWSSHKEAVVWLCLDHYNNRMDYILKRLATCLLAGRNKRDFGVAAGIAVEILGTGLTNFVKSYFSPGETDDNRNQDADLQYELKKQTLSILESRGSRTNEFAKAVTAFSESSQYHLD